MYRVSPANAFFVPLLWVVVLATCASPASAGPVSLSDAQRAKMAELVKSDPGAKRQFEELKRQADAALKESPNPIAEIRSEGKLPRDPEKIRTLESLPDLRKVYALGFANAVSGEAPYADKAKQFLLAWAKVNHSRGDPIDDTNLEPAIVGYDLIRQSCPEGDRKAIDHWLLRSAEAEVESAAKHPNSTKNNWQSHRLKIVGLVGLLLDDRKLVDYAAKGFREQVDHNLEPDGSSHDFHDRDALHYHCYDLDPMLTLAIAFDQAGKDLYSHKSPKGASLAKSVQFLVPYCDGRKTHAEWVHSKVAFDRQRAEAGDAHYKAGTPFDPRSGRHTLELAAYFDPALNKLVERLSAEKGEEAKKQNAYPTWRMVLNAVQKRGTK
jgi:Alginate lyase